MPTRLSEILDLYRYDEWAARRVLEAASRLSPEQLQRETGGSFPSVLATLAHVLSANWVWLSRWNGDSPTGWPADWTVRDFPSLAFYWERVHRERDAWLAALREPELDRVFDYRSTRGDAMRSTVAETLRHVINHASYHRGQVINQLRAVGGQPVGTDLIAWYREQSAPRAEPLEAR